MEFKGVYRDTKVLVTGHTGFKGSWLSLWLQQLEARVVGYSLPPPTTPSNFIASDVRQNMTHIEGDIRDFEKLDEVFKAYEPEVVFHLAAQPIVLHSYTNPKETFDVNVGGTVNVLEAARKCPTIKGVVVITTDKCYENFEWVWGYRENDRLGGRDPYSASKAMAELATFSYRETFFSTAQGLKIASARAGNVIGGGDFSEYRIVPDCMKALMNGKPVFVRNPDSVRPWLHVLDALNGYLSLGAHLLRQESGYAEAWNFGPFESQAITVKELVEKAISYWGEGDWIEGKKEDAKPEMGMLRLNWDKAAQKLKWRPKYTWCEAVEETVHWFKKFHQYTLNDGSVDMREVCLDQIRRYSERCQFGSQLQITQETKL